MPVNPHVVAQLLAPRKPALRLGFEIHMHANAEPKAGNTQAFLQFPLDFLPLTVLDWYVSMQISS